MTIARNIAERRDDLNMAVTLPTLIEALRKRYPELADQVVEEQLTIAGALAEAHERDEIERNRRETACRTVEDALFRLTSFASAEFMDNLAQWLKDGKFRKALGGGNYPWITFAESPSLEHAYEDGRMARMIVMATRTPKAIAATMPKSESSSAPKLPSDTCCQLRLKARPIRASNSPSVTTPLSCSP